jgi:hypothetical protein
LAREQARKEGKCIQCKADLTPDDGIRCSECAERNKGYGRLARERAKKEGMCTTCMLNPAKENMLSCESCLERQNRRRQAAPQQ